jgi:hypothetical protein
MTQSTTIVTNLMFICVIFQVGNPKVMTQDFLWRQFLWFCFRNVLWYGESGGVLSSFSWRQEIQVTNSYNILEDENTDSIAPSEQGIVEDQHSTNDSSHNIVVLSTMERKLRQI